MWFSCLPFLRLGESLDSSFFDVDVGLGLKKSAIDVCLSSRLNWFRRGGIAADGG